MSEKKQEDGEKKAKKPLTLKGGTLSLKSGAPKPSAPAAPGAVVEVRSRRRAPTRNTETPATDGASDSSIEKQLTTQEREARAKALLKAQSEGPKEKITRTPATIVERTAPKKPETQDEQRQRELEELQRIESQEKASTLANQKEQQEKFRQAEYTRPDAAPSDTTSYRDKLKKVPAKTKTVNQRRRGGKMTVTQVLNEDYNRDRGMSLAAQKRAREKARMAAQGSQEPAQKVFREVVVPETITVQELANRMAERGGDVIKSLMQMGVMASINQSIDADTAELIVDEFGHKLKRVTEGDVEVGLNAIDDDDKDLSPRPPVVTIMGHVDHGKTSLLDAMRKTDVVAGEAGGITQHIGAYQITSNSGSKITFLDTPGHAAFTEMRARGADVTDIVIIVVAANDSIMPQTIEAINHAKASEKPMIIAINKIDLPDADPAKVKQDLLQYDVQVEDMGGDVQTIEISAKQKLNLDALEEAILLQSELLELKANPDRKAHGAVVEAKMETGRGSVATVLVANGTLRQGDVFVVGAEFGRVRALLNDKGEQIKEAIPGMPVEILGLNGTPSSGDILDVVTDEAKAREIAEYRSRKNKENATISSAKTFDEMLAIAKDGDKKTLPVVIKGDVHGSVEAIIGSLHKMTEDSDEIAVRVLHSGVGGITESDVTLAKASNALIIGFNVRANSQAREQVQRESVDMRYYNIIYNVIDDAKAMLSGMLSPTMREEYLGQAEIKEVFNITKAGKIAGCLVTMGMVKRGAGVRLLRDDVVIHDNGVLKTLKRFKDEVKEVKEATECGMAFENYEDIKAGDIIECFEVIEEARTLD